MPRYKDTDQDSGVVAYEYGQDWIEIEFRSGRERFYRYDAARAGKDHIQEMKRLAEAGDGLNSYIMRNVRDKYSSKR